MAPMPEILSKATLNVQYTKELRPNGILVNAAVPVRATTLTNRRKTASSSSAKPVDRDHERLDPWAYSGFPGLGPGALATARPHRHY
jgi:hypothetical protein